MSESIELKQILNYKQKEALFRRQVRLSHQLFCNCGDPLRHLQGWRTTGDEGIQGTPGGEQQTGGTPDAEDMLDALMAAEG
ncbi:hypothetical protein [Mosquito VEM Anellovirus SDRB B]|nr:hypothetical protein [Mosquito VEM Anellovirus SDRB B]